MRQPIAIVAGSVLACLALAGCSPSQAPAGSGTSAAPAAPAVDPRQVRSLELYRTLLKDQSFELAAPIGKEIVDTWPGSAAATEVATTLADVTAKGEATTRRRRLVALWSYQSGKESGGDQVTASLYSNDVAADRRVRLILRRHSAWGQSAYLFGAGKGFDCRGTCMLAARFDDTPAKLAAYRPDTGEPALFIKDDVAFLARLVKTQALSIDVVDKDGGARTLVFDVGGYDAARFPPLAKSRK